MSSPKKTDSTTEEKIIEAARKVFTKKGYAATRTRDIAEEADINLALLNYYFRSKEKLFEKIMLEKVYTLFGAILPVLNEEDSTIEEKIGKIVDRYINMLINNPDLPIFVLSEIRQHAERLGTALNIRPTLLHSAFARQLRERKPDTNPLHFIMNMLGMTLFPFIAHPVLKAADAIDQDTFRTMMEERKKMIPLWMEALMAS